MPVIFSRACEYAIRGLIEMARHPEQKNWKIQDLAEGTNAPAPYLVKTFQILVKSQILNSTKGRLIITLTVEGDVVGEKAGN